MKGSNLGKNHCRIHLGLGAQGKLTDPFEMRMNAPENILADSKMFQSFDISYPTIYRMPS